MNSRLIIALAVYILWVAVTLLGAKLLLGGQEAELEALVKNGIGWQFVAAVALLFIVIFVFKWRDLKFSRPHSLLKVMWFPILVLSAISLLTLITGLPASKTLLFIALNTFLVGVSEEVMFRGVLFRAFLENFKVWSAIIITTLLFGVVHVLNGFTTGDWGMAMLQAVAACMSGLIFIAIVIRTGSIWPAIIYHFAWDCILFLMGAASASQSNSGAAPVVETSASGAAVLLPLLIALPNFICAMVLLRKVRDADFRQEMQG